MSQRASETGAVKTASETATTTSAEPSRAAAAAAEDADVGRAFAVIDEIVSGCPGEMDGLRVGDRVCAVGDVRWGTRRELSRRMKTASCAWWCSGGGSDRPLR